MKHIYLKKLLLLLLLMTGATASADNAYIDGIYYNLNTTMKTAEVTAKSKSKYSGDIKIPSSITYNQVEYVVNSIGSKAFYYCTGLTSVTIPSSVTSIGSSAFSNCKGLKKVIVNDIAAWCKIKFEDAYSQPLSYADHLYSDESTEIKDLVIPNSVTSIGNYAFLGCTGLTSVTIPNSVTSIGSSAFSSCSGLTSVTIPNSVTSIGKYAFSSCTGLTSVTIGNGVTSIGESAFYSCSGLTSVTIPNSVTSIGSYAFQGCIRLASVTIGNSVTSIGTDMFSNCSSLNRIVVEQGNPIYDSRDNCNAIVNTKWNTLILGCRTTIIPNSVTGIGSYAFSNCADWSRLTIPNSVTSIGSYAFHEDHILYVHHGAPALLCLWSDDRDYRIYDTETDEKIVLCVTTPSSIRIYDFKPVVGYTKKSETIKVGNKTIEGNYAKGLESQNIRYFTWDITLQDDEGKTYSYNIKKQFDIPIIKITTMQPKVVSPGNVIVAAQSNLDDEEENVGFEWRRTDWTDDFPSNSGQAFLYDGQMEGYIRNLNTDKLWKYRPYYESASGTRYYGEWVGLDPTNTSYFEPTVHTYAQVNVQGNTASVRGYAMRGSDNTAEQGFKYWKSTASARAMAPGVPSNAETVTATGVVMEASLTNLDYESTYCYVAFVKTSEGETFYGDQRQFTTGVDPDGIEGTIADKADVKPVAYYDLNGRRLQTPQPSLVIVRMSDGSVRKVMKK